jgi:[NiFe] hydrogenase assembly HybE family chaperone
LSSTDTGDAELSARLVAAFEAIHRERMAGLPILHPGLAVAVVDARRWQGGWLGVLVTPWSMNLVMVPGRGADLASAGPGASRLLDLPAGRFEFLVSELDGVGTIAACSLFSPMHAFADQAAAEATAAAAMVSLFEPATGAAAGPASADHVESQRAGISRRDLLRGSLHPGRP